MNKIRIQDLMIITPNDGYFYVSLH